MIRTTLTKPYKIFVLLASIILFCVDIAGANTNNSIANDETSATHIISGSLTLPQPNSQISDLHFDLNLCSNGGNLNPSECLYYAEVFIPNGEIAGSFSMEVSSELETDWDLSYNCFECLAPLMRSGYYDGLGETTWDERSRVLLPSGQDHININILVQTGSVISGSITIPEDLNIGAEYLYISVSAETADIPNLDCCQTKSILLAPYRRSVNYSIAVPPTSSLQWHIQYDCYLGLVCESNVVNSSGYYSLMSPMTTTQNFIHRSLLSGGRDYQGIDLTLSEISSTPSEPTRKFVMPPIMLLLDPT